VRGVWRGADVRIQWCIAHGRAFGYMHYNRGVGAVAAAFGVHYDGINTRR